MDGWKEERMIGRTDGRRDEWVGGGSKDGRRTRGQSSKFLKTLFGKSTGKKNLSKYCLR